jgi:aspartate/methionine/tyrosine aminotransferase
MFDVLEKANQREAAGHYVARMEIGDTPGFYNRAIHEKVAKFASSPFRYSPSRGEPRLIEKVIATQWPHASHENIVIGPANFLITAALASKTSSGDIVLLPDPGFPSYKLSADFLGLNVIYYPVGNNIDNGFPDIRQFISKMDYPPKVIVINNPSNPLGLAFSGKEIETSLSDISALGTSVIFDETYINLIYDGTDAFTPSIDAIRIRSFSKEHCAPGLRVGYAYGDAESTKCMADLISLSVSCIPQFIQFAISEYLGSALAYEFTNELNLEMKSRFHRLSLVLPTGSLNSSPNAAFYAMINVGERGGESAFLNLMESNVSTCPGTRFGYESRNTVRVSLAGAAEHFDKDLEMLSIGLARWNNL